MKKVTCGMRGLVMGLALMLSVTATATSLESNDNWVEMKIGKKDTHVLDAIANNNYSETYEALENATVHSAWNKFWGVAKNKPKAKQAIKDRMLVIAILNKSFSLAQMVQDKPFNADPSKQIEALGISANDYAKMTKCGNLFSTPEEPQQELVTESNKDDENKEEEGILSQLNPNEVALKELLFLQEQSYGSNSECDKKIQKFVTGSLSKVNEKFEFEVAKTIAGQIEKNWSVKNLVQAIDNKKSMLIPKSKSVYSHVSSQLQQQVDHLEKQEGFTHGDKIRDYRLATKKDNICVETTAKAGGDWFASLFGEQNRETGQQLGGMLANMLKSNSQNTTNPEIEDVD